MTVGGAWPAAAEVQTTGPRRGRSKRGLVAAGVVVIAAAAGFLAMRGDRTTVVISEPPASTPSTEETAPAPNDDGYDTTALLADLGPDVTSTVLGTVPGPPTLLDVAPAALCLANHVVRVYEYPSADRRAALSDRISSDGSQVPAGPAIAIPEWIAPPHFYARGRIIVLWTVMDTTTAAARVIGLFEGRGQLDRLEHVDTKDARACLDRAKERLSAASMLAEGKLWESAFTASYDGYRTAADAVVLFLGYRVPATQGGHRIATDIAHAAMQPDTDAFAPAGAGVLRPFAARRQDRRRRRLGRRAGGPSDRRRRNHDLNLTDRRLRAGSAPLVGSRRCRGTTRRLS